MAESVKKADLKAVLTGVKKPSKEIQKVMEQLYSGVLKNLATQYGAISKQHDAKKKAAALMVREVATGIGDNASKLTKEQLDTLKHFITNKVDNHYNDRAELKKASKAVKEDFTQETGFKPKR